jgi:hypothetical protein
MARRDQKCAIRESTLQIILLGIWPSRYQSTYIYIGPNPRRQCRQHVQPLHKPLWWCSLLIWWAWYSHRQSSNSGPLSRLDDCPPQFLRALYQASLGASALNVYLFHSLNYKIGTHLCSPSDMVNGVSHANIMPDWKPSQTKAHTDLRCYPRHEGRPPRDGPTIHRNHKADINMESLSATIWPPDFFYTCAAFCLCSA